MKLFSGKLTLRKSTKSMLVYGDETLHAQYVPKSLLEEAGCKGEPADLIFIIKVPDKTSSNGRGVSKLTADNPSKQAMKGVQHGR